MRALVVYESMFGNTQQIAEAIGHGLASAGIEVDVLEVGSAPDDPAGVDLLVVGGPTHTFTLSREETRTSAAAETSEPLVSTGVGLRDWLDALPSGKGRAAAAFDTHADKRLPGSASKSARKRLRRRGYIVTAPPTSFFVSDMTGPLLEGEIDRAERFGAELATAGKPTRRATHGRP